MVAGGTGLVGGLLVQRLLEDARYEQVHAVGRRPLGLTHPRLHEHMVVLDALAAWKDCPAVDDAYCALGTTLGKAGSRALFRAVDLDAVVAFARVARAAGAQRFLLVSALGADARSKMFYNRTKGEAEEAVAALGFPEVHVVRPSLLDGPRRESRPLEQLSLVVARAAAPLLGHYRPIHADDVARAMVGYAFDGIPGVSVHESDHAWERAHRA
ncbi:MAG: NAD(P)H-binding protein [Deltaproteobacteria bacterium]|nr:NAD(P)H-binding protein [Deltaproteobacteria bacterium]